MFSIYGVTGQVFSGTLEQMNRVRALSNARAARALADGGDELGIEAISSISGRSQDDAVRAYVSMLPPDLERGPLIHASQIMQNQVVTVFANDAVSLAWRTLRDKGIHQAPVLDERAQLIGIVSERDLLTAIDIDGDQIIESMRRHVRDVMKTPVVAAHPITDIRRIASVMLDNRVDGVPIVSDSRRLVGFVSRGDVLRAVVTDPPLSLWR